LLLLGKFCSDFYLASKNELGNLRRNPNNKTDEYLNEMNWPEHSLESEYYLDIGTHLVEKRGLFLERYTVWDETGNTGSFNKIGKFLLIASSLLAMRFRF
jgi:hypothetical protein